MLNLVTDEQGSVKSLAYRRSSVTVQNEVEYIGYGVGEYRGERSVDFGENGCLSGYRLAFAATAGDGRLLQEEASELAGMQAISNPAIQESVRVIAKDIGSSDVVMDPGADRGRTDMLSGSTGLFDWATTKNLTGVSACEGPSGSIAGLKMIFTDADSGLTETKQLGS